MDAATKQFLERMQATLEDSITSWRNASTACHEVLVQKLELQSTPVVTTDGVVEPVPASSGTAELVTVAVGLAEPQATVPIIEESLAVAPATPTDTISVASAACSTKCAAQTATESTPALTSAAAPTSPTATLVDVPMLAATAASEGTLDSDTICGATSTPDAYIPASVCALTLAELPTVSTAPTAPTPRENIEVEVLSMVDVVSDDSGADQRPPWPPPELEIMDCHTKEDAGGWIHSRAIVAKILLHQFGKLLPCPGSITVNDTSSTCALVQWKNPWTISLVSRQFLFQYCSADRASLQGCDNFQWTNAWSVSYHSSLLSLHTLSTSVILFVPCYLTSHGQKEDQRMLQYGFDLLQWKIAWSHQFECPEIATHLNLDDVYTSFWCMSNQRTILAMVLILCLNMLTPQTCLRILVSSTIDLHPWIGSVMDSTDKRQPQSVACSVLHRVHQYMFEEKPPQVKFKRGTRSLCFQWKPPWPSFRLVSSGSVVSHLILERFQQCNSVGLMEVIFSAPASHMPQLVDIPGMQQGSAFLDPTASCTTGIPIHISDTRSVLQIFWSPAALPSLLMNFFFEETLKEKPRYNIIMVPWASGYKLLNISFLNYRTSTTCALYHSAQFRWKAAEPFYDRSNYCSTALIGLQVCVNLFIQEHAREPLFSMELGGVAFYSSFSTCTSMKMEQSKGSSELIQWLANNPCGSILSTIKSIQDMNTLFSWIFMDLDDAANQYWKIKWDPGGPMFALCSSNKRWTAHLHHSEQLQWSSLWLAGAFRIWLVAWIVYVLEVSTGCGQAPFQGGRNAIAVTTFFEQASAGHKYYLDFCQVHASDNYNLGDSFDWVSVSDDYSYYLVQAYHNFGYYGDPGQIKGRQLQWDPCGFSGMSAWGQAEFQGGRDVRNLSYTYSYPGWSPGPPHGPGPDSKRHATSTWEETTTKASGKDQAWHRRLLLLPPPALDLPCSCCFPLLAHLCL